MSFVHQLTTNQVEKMLLRCGELKKNTSKHVTCQLTKPIKGFKLLEVKPFLTPCIASVIIPAGSLVKFRVVEQCSDDSALASFIDNLHSRVIFSNSLFVHSIVSLQHPEAVGPKFLQDIGKGKIALDMTRVEKTNPFLVAYAHSPNSTTEQSHVYVSGATHIVSKSHLAVHVNMADALLALKLGVTKNDNKS